MNEERYKNEDLQDYRGILTSVARSGQFKMELKVEDNSVLERWAEKNKPTIELEFKYNFENSIEFVHNRKTCPNNLQNKECNECERRGRIYGKFEANLEYLQLGDTFRIKAVLINNDQSTLPGEIHDFERYQPLLVACTEDRLILPDTPEGVAKKQELVDQRLKSEQDAKEKREADEKKAKWDNMLNGLEQRLAKRPYITRTIITVVITAIVTTFLNQMPHILGLLKKIPQLFSPN